MLTERDQFQSIPTIEQTDNARLIDAELFAWAAHEGQVRKLGEREPFATHPVGVVEALREAGIYDTDVLIAALLHDTVEMGKVTLEVIEQRYGQRVRDIVDGVTKRTGFATREEKQQDYLGRLDGGNKDGERAPQESLLVALADKIHNIEDLIENHLQLTHAGESTNDMWSQFKSGAAGTLQWHRDVLGIGKKYLGADHPLVSRLDNDVTKLSELLLASGAIRLAAIDDTI